MGMMDINNWKGSWVSDSWDKNKKESPYFRYEFSAQKKIKKARLTQISDHVILKKWQKSWRSPT